MRFNSFKKYDLAYKFRFFKNENGMPSSPGDVSLRPSRAHDNSVNEKGKLKLFVLVVKLLVLGGESRKALSGTNGGASESAKQLSHALGSLLEKESGIKEPLNLLTLFQT